MDEQQAAAAVRAAIAELNKALAEAARAGLRVDLTVNTHRTTSDTELLVVEAKLFKRI